MLLIKLFQLLVTLAAVYVCINAVSMRRVPKSSHFLFVALCNFIYALGYFLELDSHTLEAAFFAQRIRFFGVPFIGVSTFLFVRSYDNRPIRDLWKIAMMMVVPVTVVIAVNAYPDITLYYQSLTFEAEPSPHLLYARGPLYFVNVLYNLVFIGLTTTEILLFYPSRNDVERRTRRMFLGTILFPITAVLLLAMDFLPLPMDFGSAALVLGTTFLGHFIVRHRPQDWLPFAREQIIESIRDAYVLVDEEGRFLDANAEAVRCFPKMRGMTPGSTLEGVADFPSEMARITGAQRELYLGAKDKYMMASSTAIPREGGVLCTCLLFYDVTENRRLVKELEALAMHDPLTGLFNRNALFRAGAHDFELSQRMCQPLTVLMMDIDRFKDVNDQYGHPTGDEVLRSVGAAIRGRLRQTDLGARYGGEEFLALLPGTAVEGAFVIANDIRSRIAESAVISGGSRIKITISIGLARADFTRHARLEELIADADEALYRAKEEGRNRVVVYEKPS